MTKKPKHEIDIVINPDGTMTSTVKGVAGPTCDGLADWLKSLGETTDEGKTADYYRKSHQTVTVGGRK